MAIQIIGNGGVIAEVEANFRSLRTCTKPDDVGSLGAYRVSTFTGLLSGVAANAPIFSARWGDATRLCVMRFLGLHATVITGFTAAQELALNGFIARSFTASDTGGTAINLTGNNQKKRTSFGTSLFTDMRISAAAALTAGTRTLDAQGFLAILGRTPAVASVNESNIGPSISADFTQAQDWPIVFAQNEGFVINNVIALGAGGTLRVDVTFGWEELASY